MCMTIWERLEKYGHIKGMKRKEDPRRFDVFLENGLVKIQCKKGINATVTIDTFLYLFMENRPCEYPQYIPKEESVK